jgi:hypothetical protein
MANHNIEVVNEYYSGVGWITGFNPNNKVIAPNDTVTFTLYSAASFSGTISGFSSTVWEGGSSGTVPSNGSLVKTVKSTAPENFVDNMNISGRSNFQVRVVDRTPSNFTFNSLTNEPQSVQRSSNTVTLSGFDSAGLNVTGNADLIQVYVNGQPGNPGSVSNGDTLSVRMKTSVADNTTTYIDVTIGNLTKRWNVTTALQVDDAPAKYSFSPYYNQDPNLSLFRTTTITGINVGATVSIVGTNAPVANFNINSAGSQTANGTITNNQTLRAGIKPGGGFDTEYYVDIKVGTGANSTERFSLFTRSADINPTAFSIGGNLTGQNLSQEYVSSFTLSGVEVPVSVGSLNGSHKIGSGGSWSGNNAVTNNVPNGSTIYFRMYSSNTQNTSVTGKLTVGSGSNSVAERTIVTRTLDADPVDFSLGTDGSNASLGNYAYSSSTNITGMDVGAITYASVSANGQYRINNSGLWYSSSDSAQGISQNDSVQMRILMNNSYSNYKSATLYVGNQNDTWGATTESEPPPPDTYPNALTFSSYTNASRNQIITRSDTVTGIDTTVTATATGFGRLSVDGTNFYSSVSVSNNTLIYLRITASSAYSTTHTGGVNIGGRVGSFSVTTEADPTDTYPSILSFTDNGAAELDTPVIRSDTVSGINTTVTAAATGFASVSLDGVNFYSSVSVNNGTLLYIRVISSSSYSITRSGSVNVGSRTNAGTLNVLTKDQPSATTFPYTSPDVFSFTDLKTFFNGSNNFSDYVRGGLYVPDIAQNNGISNTVAGLSFTQFYDSGKN